MKESLLFTRRDFLRASTVLAVGAAMPSFLLKTAEAAFAAASGAIPGFADDRILVVVQLAGGNDGLNMVAPVGDDAYARARPKLGLKPGKVLDLGDGLSGLNPRMTGLKELFDSGKLGIVEGVGYPNPNRSHFRSTEIWQTAVDSDKHSPTGWIGRYLDAQCNGEGQPTAAMALGDERPQAFAGKRGLGVCLQDVDSFGWLEGPGEARQGAFLAENGGGKSDANPARGGAKNESLEFVRKVALDAVAAENLVRETARKARVGTKYPADRFGQGLQTIAKMIGGGLPTRIYYVTLGGFDTHANQAGSHDNLLQRLSDGLLAFQRDLAVQGNEARVTTLTFSEFGRRVGENASGGTDHGTAAPMLLLGGGVKPGLHGKRPSLTELDRGDLIHTTDFRSVYAAIIQQRLGAPADKVLGWPGAPAVGLF